MAELKRTGQYDRTIIVVTGDHGEQFGEHDLYSHGNSVHRSVVHVPLVVSAPGHVPAGRHVQLPVSLCDVGQTLLQLSAHRDAQRFPGVSLAAAWSPEVADRPVRPALTTVDPHPRLDIFPHMRLSPARHGKQYALLSGDLYVISEGDQTWQLYDFARGSAGGERLGATAVPAGTAAGHSTNAGGRAKVDAWCRAPSDNDLVDPPGRGGSDAAPPPPMGTGRCRKRAIRPATRNRRSAQGRSSPAVCSMRNLIW